MRFCEAPNCNQPVFGTCKQSRKGYCKSHQSLREDFDRRSITQRAIDKHNQSPKETRKINQREKTKVRSLIGSGGNVEMVEKDKVAKAELDLWFMVKMKESPRICENCGKDLSGLNDTDWKGSQHHILEKSIYKSVRTHSENHLVLGRWCCHPQFHTSMLNASKMPIFPEANRKVVEMLPLLKPEEIRRISEYYIIPT